MQALVANQRPRIAAYGAGAIELALKPVQALIAAPTLLLMASLTAMLLCHPEIRSYEINRIAFGLLVLSVMGRAVVFRDRLFAVERILWPMIGLTVLALTSIIGRPFDKETWSLLGTKYVIPFVMFYAARAVFTREAQFRKFEIFSLAVLAYLSFTAVAFLVDARALIFPKFILDPNVGYHAERARGPFLQAVANGMSLNMLGLLALHACCRGSVRGVKALVLLAAVPISILATMTRAVWLSFAGTVFALILLSRNSTIRRACVGLALVAAIAMAAVVSSPGNSALSERLSESSPVEYRKAVYAGSWEMFQEKPLMGWGFHQMPDELPSYVSEFRDKVLYPHNTYLEVLVEQGAVGLGLYVWLMWELLRLGRGGIPTGEQRGFLNADFHRLWPILLGVYWVNAALVVMSYQFVNALVFSLAGMLAGQRRRAEAAKSC